MEPNLIALGIIVMVVFSATITFFFRVKPWHVIFQGGRIWWSLLAAVFSCSFIVSATGVAHKCGIEGPEPEGGHLGIILFCCVLGLILFVDKKIFMILSCLVVLAISILLGNQIDALVYESSDYYAIDSKTHRLMPKGCLYDLSTMNVVAKEQWHSWLTGIYKVKKQSGV